MEQRRRDVQRHARARAPRIFGGADFQDLERQSPARLDRSRARRQRHSGREAVVAGHDASPAKAGRYVRDLYLAANIALVSVVFLNAGSLPIRARGGMIISASSVASGVGADVMKDGG